MTHEFNFIKIEQLIQNQEQKTYTYMFVYNYTYMRICRHAERDRERESSYTLKGSLGSDVKMTLKDTLPPSPFAIFLDGFNLGT